MPSIDDYPETPKHADSQKNLEDRKAQRLAGKLNPAVRGVRGLAHVVEAMQGRGKHSLFCKCEECIPPGLWGDGVLPLAVDAPKVAPTIEPRREKSKPRAKGNRAKNGFKQPAKKWDARCSTCQGAGEVPALKGGKRPCPRCSEA